MEDRKVIVNISRTAVIKTEAFGYTGSACMKPLELISRALGTTVSAQAKPEFFASEEVQNFATG